MQRLLQFRPGDIIPLFDIPGTHDIGNGYRLERHENGDFDLYDDTLNGIKVGFSKESWF